MAKEVTENAPKKKKNMLMIIIIAVLVVVIVIGGAFSAYMIFIKKPATGNSETASETATNTAAAAGHATTTAKTTTLNPKYLYEVSPYTYEFKDEFLVNLSDEGGKRYLKVKIFLGYETKDKKKMDAELEERKPILRDAINGVLRSKKSTDLSGEKGIDDVKNEILVRISSILTEGRPNNVYFSDMVIQ